MNVQVSASNTTDWSIGANAGHDVFKLEVLGDNAVVLTNGDQTFENPLEANLQSGYQETWGLKLTMPTTSSTNDQQTSTITFTSTIL